MPLITILIPTRNESKNIQSLVQRIQVALRDTSHQILFVDDSDDETPKTIEELRSANRNIGLLHRPQEARNGLAGAVVDGLCFVTTRYVAVMDADLQHPPEVLPTMVDRLNNGADLVIGSRYVEGGNDGGLVGFRRAVSWTARKIGQLAIGKIRNVTDCTSGFFAFRNDINVNSLNPIGWKILIEILVKTPFSRIEEIGFKFEERQNEQSKMSIKEQINYLLHIYRLAKREPWTKYVKFAIVGGLGVAINQIIMSVLMRITDALDASVIASLLTIIINYYINSKWTWKTKHKHIVYGLGQSILYFTISLLGMGTTTGIFYTLYANLGLSPNVAQLGGILLTSVWTYFAHNTITFRGETAHA